MFLYIKTKILLIQGVEIRVEDDQSSVFGGVIVVFAVGHQHFVVLKFLFLEEVNYWIDTAVDSEHGVTIHVVVLHVYGLTAEWKQNRHFAILAAF